MSRWLEMRERLTSRPSQSGGSQLLLQERNQGQSIGSQLLLQERNQGQSGGSQLILQEQNQGQSSGSQLLLQERNQRLRRNLIQLDAKLGSRQKWAETVLLLQGKDYTINNTIPNVSKAHPFSHKETSVPHDQVFEERTHDTCFVELENIGNAAPTKRGDIIDRSSLENPGMILAEKGDLASLGNKERACLETKGEDPERKLALASSSEKGARGPFAQVENKSALAESKRESGRGTSGEPGKESKEEREKRPEEQPVRESEGRPEGEKGGGPGRGQGRGQVGVQEGAGREETLEGGVIPVHGRGQGRGRGGGGRRGAEGRGKGRGQAGGLRGEDLGEGAPKEHLKSQDLNISETARHDNVLIKLPALSVNMRMIVSEVLCSIVFCM